MKVARCIQCGRLFRTRDDRNQRFCSRECYAEWWAQRVLREKIIPKRARAVTVRCAYCGKPITVPPSLLRGRKHKFCSRECFRLYRKEHPEEYARENHWNWKGGVTEERQRMRQSEEYRRWRDAVFRRDRWTCQMCGYKGHKIVAHHIIPVSERPDLAFDPSNGITLCRSCHKRLHYGVGEETRFKKGQRPHNKLQPPPREELERLYWGSRLSTVEIAKLYGVCHKTVRKWLRLYGIPVRSLSEARRNYLRKRRGGSPEVGVGVRVWS